jgi:hypothetical protein
MIGIPSTIFVLARFSEGLGQGSRPSSSGAAGVTANVTIFQKIEG